MSVRFELVGSGTGTTSGTTPYESDPVNLYGSTNKTVPFVVVVVERTAVVNPAYTASPTVRYNGLSFPICMTETESAQVLDSNTRYHISMHQYTEALVGGAEAPIVITPPDDGFTYTVSWMAYRAIGVSGRPTIYDITGGTFRLAADDGDLNGTLSFYSNQDQIADGQFAAFYCITEAQGETLGDGWSTAAGIDSLTVGVNRLRCYYNRTTDPTEDPTTLHAATASITSTANAWIYVSALVLAADGTESGARPPLSSSVPFLQANDRYQVVACVNQATSTTPPEFRYWYANAPLWGEQLQGDTNSPPFYSYDEDFFYNPGSLELPFKVIKVNQEAQVDGVEVDFNTRPSEVTEFMPSAATVGFSVRVEGYGIPDYSRTIGTSSTTGNILSVTRSYETTISPQVGEPWPNTRTVFIPLRVERVRAARIIFTDVRQVQIVRAQLIGKMLPQRVA